MNATELTALLVLSSAASFTPGPNTTLSTALAGSATLAQADDSHLQVTFWQGVALQFLNIKAWMLAFGLLSNLAYALIGSLLRDWLGGPQVGGVATGGRLRWFNRGMAAVLVFTAAWMATL